MLTFLSTWLLAPIFNNNSTCTLHRGRTSRYVVGAFNQFETRELVFSVDYIDTLTVSIDQCRGVLLTSLIRYVLTPFSFSRVLSVGYVYGIV